MAQFWLGTMSLPVIDRRRTGTKPLSGLALEESEVEVALPNVLTERKELAWIRLRQRLGDGPAQRTTRQ